MRDFHRNSAFSHSGGLTELDFAVFGVGERVEVGVGMEGTGAGRARGAGAGGAVVEVH